MVVLWSWRSGEIQACRTCGIVVAEEALNGTMVKGWWGVIAVLANLVAVATNVAAWFGFRALALPRPTGEQLMRPAPLLGRPGVWITAALVLLVVWSLASAA